MPRKSRKSKRRQTVSDAWILWACDGEIPEDEPRRDDWLTFQYFSNEAELRAFWQQDGQRAIEAWIAANGPGTRPANYWRYALPRAGELRFGHPLASPFLDDESQAEYLVRHGLLLNGERV
ncbi:hypothetical protein ACG873_07240 [Mesorhizobium sp. AaZ16]|uniref:hypothetical protein n=1 Tax=Mesorhizobium sp. AaZ16 TaxID=3402289 RepID=UPI00374F3F6D